MRLTRLEVIDFRGYRTAAVDWAPGVSILLGRNGHGKTNLIEAAGYVATLASHRVSLDAPLIRHGCQSAIVRASIERDERESLVELEIMAGRQNKARLNRSPTTRPRDVLGCLRTVLFAPEDLALVKGDPAERRRFLDDLLVSRQPRWAGVRQDYDKALKQRNAVLKSAKMAGRNLRADPQESTEATLAVFDTHLAQIGAALTYARLRLLHDLTPYVSQSYAAISDADSPASVHYRSSLHEDVAACIAGGEVPPQSDLEGAILSTMAQRRQAEWERGVSLVGPHRDDMVLGLGDVPAKGYASQGESWSFALALRLAAFALLRHDLGTDPVLILDDVFSELDTGRRRRLVALISDCEQVVVTAAVAGDVPSEFDHGAVFDVSEQSISLRAPAP